MIHIINDRKTISNHIIILSAVIYTEVSFKEVDGRVFRSCVSPTPEKTGL